MVDVSWKSNEVRERERKDLEQNLLPRLEFELEVYTVERFSSQLERRNRRYESSKEYEFSRDFMLEPETAFSYFLVGPDQNIWDNEFAAAISQEDNLIICNDTEIEPELRDMKGDWENRKYLKEAYESYMDIYTDGLLAFTAEEPVVDEFEVYMMLPESVREPRFGEERKRVKDQISSLIDEEYQILGPEKAYNQLRQLKGSKGDACINLRRFRDRRYIPEIFVLRDELDMHDFSNGYFGFTVSVEDRVIESRSIGLQSAVKDLQETWRENTTIEDGKEILISRWGEVEFTSRARITAFGEEDI
ncbi:MAG: hypothetical protein SVV03_00015 [Candidatus Nanohaloarchaea archaeon]|nr:hypothetical protein [Candidatus Nanohaloarchaea archaeon]